jgi:hypothetical protein
MSLQGIMTGIAAVLTAVAGLLVALHQVGLFPRPSDTIETLPAPPGASPSPVPKPGPERAETARVDGVEVSILGAKRSFEAGAAFVDIDYEVATGSGFVSHDPASFVKFVTGGQAVAPVWTSVTTRGLSPNSRADFAVRFQVPSDSAKKIVLRFGETHYLDLPVQLTD